MAHMTKYPAGRISWVDVNVTDLDAAKAFYGGLFGWEFAASNPEFGGYTLARTRGQNVAGLMPSDTPEIPPVWSVYFATDDIDSTAERVLAHGGRTIVEPMPVGAEGVMYFGVDPTGTAFGAWQAGTHTGSALWGEAPAMCWHELNTRDGARADRFYTEVFGVDTRQIGDGEKLDYTVWSVEGTDVCGRLQMNDDWSGDVPAHWTTYFAVDDCDAAARAVSELGGDVINPPADSDHGRIATVADPWNATFTVITPVQQG